MSPGAAPEEYISDRWICPPSDRVEEQPGKVLLCWAQLRPCMEEKCLGTVPWSHFFDTFINNPEK